MTPLLSLCPVGPDEFGRVSHIQVAPEQVKFAGTVALAFQMAEKDVDFHAICRDGQAVGFFKIDRAYARAHWFAREGELGLRAFLIDRASQGQGIATAAVRTLGPYLVRHYPGTDSVVLTVNMANPAAITCYRRSGFVETGQVYEGGGAGPQHVMRMELGGQIMA